MPTYFQQVFRTIGQSNSNSVNRHLPMINDITESARGFLFEINQIKRKKMLMAWFKSIPELSGFVTKIARNVVSNYHFESAKTNESGRNKVMNSNKFALRTQLEDIMFSQVVDILVTGDGYGWKGKLISSKIKKNIEKAFDKRLPVELKEEMSQYKQQYVDKIYHDLMVSESKAVEGFDSSLVDEDVLAIRKYRYMPSTNMENIHDKYDFLGYNQILGANEPEFFSTDEVIRFNFMNVDGKPRGYTPVEGVLVQLELLRFMWNNMLALEKNGGHPDKVIIAKDMNVNSPAYQRMEEMLAKYKLIENKHGNMLFTGDIQIEDLMQLDQMQFKDMGLYITGVLAMQWGISKESIPYIIGDAKTAEGVGSSAQDEYFEVVRYFQRRFANDMNQQMFMPYFGTKIVFDNPNVQHSIRRETYNMQKLNNLLTVDTFLKGSGKQLKIEKRLRLLDMDIEPEDLEEEKIEPMVMPGQDGPGNKKVPKKDGDDPKKVTKSTQKRVEQEQSISSSGKVPNGVSKEWDETVEAEYKQMIGGDVETVNFDTFSKIYNEDKISKNGNSPRVFKRVNESYTTYKFKSTDFIYQTKVLNGEVEELFEKVYDL